MTFRSNALWNLAGNGLPLLAGAVAVPYLMAKLGTEKFGIVTIIWTVIGYLSLFDFGLGRALTQLTSANCSNGQSAENLGVLRSAVYLTIIAGLVGALILIALSYPLAFHWLSVSPQNQLDVFFSLIITSIAVPVTTVSAAFRGALEGLEKFKQTNLVRVFFGTACFLFPVIALVLTSPKVSNVAASLIVARVITFAFFLKSLRNPYPEYSFSLKPFKDYQQKLLSFGSWMTLSNIISPIMVSADRFIISGFMGAAIVAFYTVPFEIVVRLLIIPGAIGATLFPRLSSLFCTDKAEADRLVNKCVLTTFWVLLSCCIIIGTCYFAAVSLWINKDFAEKSYVTACLLSVGALFNGIAYVYYTAVQARNGSRATGILHSLELILYVPILIILVKQFGLVGAASAWTLRIIIDCLMLFFLYKKGRESAL